MPPNVREIVITNLMTAATNVMLTAAQMYPDEADSIARDYKRITETLQTSPQSSMFDPVQDAAGQLVRFAAKYRDSTKIKSRLGE